MAGEDFTAKYADQAVYLPSLQQAYAAFPFRDPNSVRDGELPAGLELKDLDFLNPASNLWHCKYVLYSAGQFNRAQIRTPDMVSERNPDTIVVGDSGGYQIATGKLPELKGWEKQANDPLALERRWLENISIRDRILRWLDRYSDYAMTLDMPLFILKEKKSPFRNLSADQLIELSYENLKYFADNRGKATGAKAKFLNVLQDAGDGTGEAWYKRVKDFDFEGWAFGGDTKNGIEPLLKWVRRLLDDGKLNSKTEWLHVLMMSPPANSVLLTALQKRLREILGNTITVSYDSSSPFQTSGISQKIAVLPQLTDDIKTWRIKNIQYPQNPKYLSKTDIRYLEDIVSPITQLVSINDFHAKNGTMETRFLDTLAQHLLTNHNVYVYQKAMLNASSHKQLPRKVQEGVIAVEKAIM
jgi:flagellar hook protein FlgE